MIPDTVKSLPKILMVVEDAIIAEDLGKRLEKSGYSLCPLVRSREMLMEKALGFKPDLILMDMAPEGTMDGIEAAETVYAEQKIPVVFLMNESDEKRLERAQINPLFGYILKPVRDLDLKTTIALVLHASQIDRERREIEALSQAREKKYYELNNLMYLLTDNVPDLIWAKDLDGRYLFVNRTTCEKLLKCDHPRDAIGKTDLFFADREKEAGYQHTLSDMCTNSDEIVKATGQTDRFLAEGLVRKEYLILDVHKSPMRNKEGEIIGMVGAGRDVTPDKETERALRDSEERFRSIVVTSPDGIVLQDADQNIIFCNPAFTSILGYTCREAIELGIYGIHPEDQIPIIEAAHQRRENGEWDSYELEVFHRDGRRLPILISGAPRYKNGIFIGTVAIFKDISERKRVENELNASIKEKEVLLREIHHRVKNNMQVISSLLNLQANKEKENRVVEVLKESQNRVLAMALVHEYLYQTKSLAQIDISEYIRGLAYSITQSYGNGPTPELHISFNDRINIAPDQAIPCGLAVNELVTNAVKHAFPNGQAGRVFIECYRDEEGWLNISVKDNGIGFPDQFDWRRSQTLGLALVKGLIENQLGGSVNLIHNEGATFVLRFPHKTVKNHA